MAKIGLPKGSGKRLKVREKSVKSQGIWKWILSGNPEPLLLSDHVDAQMDLNLCCMYMQTRTLCWLPAQLVCLVIGNYIQGR